MAGSQRCTVFSNILERNIVERNIHRTEHSEEHRIREGCMLFMYVALLNDNYPKHIYALSIICASILDPVFFRVFRSVYNSLLSYNIFLYTVHPCDPDTIQPHTG